MSIISNILLETGGVDSQIGITTIENRSYTHAYIIVDGKPYEPRFLGLHLTDTIRYDDPILVYNSSIDYINASNGTRWPGISDINRTFMENLIIYKDHFIERYI